MSMYRFWLGGAYKGTQVDQYGVNEKDAENKLRYEYFSKMNMQIKIIKIKKIKN